MIGSELVRPGAKTPWTRVSTRPRPDLQHLSEHLGGFGGVYPSTHPLALGYPGDRMLIAEPEHQWINPLIDQTWRCAHEGSKEPGHTTLYVIHAMSSDSVLYVGITGDVRRRFKQHRRKKPWWTDSENASLECYTSWDDAAEAERSRIQTWRPIHNIVGNEARKPILCMTCGFVIQSDTDEFNDNIGSAWPQHWKCGEAIVLAYEMGWVSTMPKDNPFRIKIEAEHEADRQERAGGR